MLQTLLADRFKLILHYEKKEVSVFALTVGKKEPKVHVSEGDGVSTMQFERNGVLSFQHTTMAELTDRLFLMNGRPVLDKTRLTGPFDFRVSLDYSSASPQQYMAALIGEGEQVPSLLAMIQEQLGFKLEAQNAAIDVLVVDHAERVPTEN